MKKEIKKLSKWQKEDLQRRIEDLNDRIVSIRESTNFAINEWMREAKHLQAQLDEKEPYKMQGGFVY